MPWRCEWIGCVTAFRRKPGCKSRKTVMRQLVTLVSGVEITALFSVFSAGTKLGLPCEVSTQPCPRGPARNEQSVAAPV
jgi:hypothetical protein